MTTTYKYWVAGVKTHLMSPLMGITPEQFNIEIEVDFEVKTSDDIMKLTQIILEKFTTGTEEGWKMLLSSWPHLLGITRDGHYSPYVTMVKLD